MAVNLNQLRTCIFGREADVHVPKQIRTRKFVPWAEEVIVVEIDCEDAYRVLMKDYKKVIISKGVSFEESSAVLENLAEASTTRVDLELSGLKSE